MRILKTCGSVQTHARHEIVIGSRTIPDPGRCEALGFMHWSGPRAHGTLKSVS